MAAATARFLDEFSRAVFRQWQEQAASSAAAAPRFWRDAARLRQVLQDAAAKLPRGPLKAALTRDLDAQAAALGTLLSALDAASPATPESRKERQKRTRELLNEADVERAQTLHETAALADICVGDDEPLEPAKASVAALEALAARFMAVLGRQYESEAEQRAKCGAIARRVVQTVDALARDWVSRASWVVDKPAEDLAAARRVLHGLAQLDGALSSEVADASVALPAPWTSFYRPPARDSDADYDHEMAGVFAWLVALAVYFPVERDAASDSSDSSSDSDATSAGEDEDAGNSSRPAARSLLESLDAVPMAELAAQRAVLAAQQRGRRAGVAGGVDRAWLVRALTRLSALPKPSKYSNAEGDEVMGLPSDDWRAIWDCVGALYTHALAAPMALTDASASESDAVRTIVCVRQAALFMRTQRKQALPAVAAAAATLARVPLPRSFTRWMSEAKRQLRGKAEHEELLGAIRQLSDKAWAGLVDPNEQPTAGVLLREANVALDKLLAMQRNYEAYLAQEAREEARALPQTQRPAVVIGEAPTDPESLFFVDSAGGAADAASADAVGGKKRSRKKKKKKSSSSSNNNNNKKKADTAEELQEAAAKRQREA